MKALLLVTLLLVQTAAWAEPRPCTGSPSSWDLCAGKSNYPDGSSYDGMWKSGKPNGPGTLRKADGGQYSGEWLRGRPNGKGTYTYPGGRQYTGGFFNGEPTGEGSMTWPDGTKYVGEFKNGLPDQKLFL